MASDKLIVQSITIKDLSGTTIGAIETINPQHSLGIVKLREINAALDGEVTDIIPGVEDISISVNGFAIRSVSTSAVKWLPSRLSATRPDQVFKGLIGYKTPFTIQINQIAADGSNAEHTIVYKNCLLSSYSMQIQINGNVVVTENATIAVGSCYSI